MENQMSIRKLVVLIVSVVSLSACSKKEGETAIGRDTGNISPTTAWAEGSQINANGVVLANSSQQSLFQDAVTGYIEAIFAPENLGFISATASNGTGFFFGGKVQLQNGLLNPAASMAQVNIRSDSKLYVEIVDEYTNRPDSSGANVLPITRGYAQSSGYVQGNRAYIKFTDKYGSVEFDGTFSAQKFIGTFTYDNAMSYNDGPGAAGTIGQFEVPTCQFFRCQ